METPRTDDVRIELRRGTVSIPAPSRDALLRQLGARDSTSELHVLFEAAGTTDPIRPTDPQKLGLRNAIAFWANQIGGTYEALPDGIHALRDALQDDLLDVGAEAAGD